jgi:hypothetical protein
MSIHVHIAVSGSIDKHRNELEQVAAAIERTLREHGFYGAEFREERAERAWRRFLGDEPFGPGGEFRHLKLDAYRLGGEDHGS